MVQMVVGFNVLLSQGMSGLTDLDQTLSLPLSLFLGTIGAIMVSWQVATNRAKPSMAVDWFWELLGRSYDLFNLWRLVLLGLSLGLGFFALTEYGMLPPDDLPQPLFDAMLAAPFVLQILWVLMFVVLLSCCRRNALSGFPLHGFGSIVGADGSRNLYNVGLCRRAYAKSVGILAGIDRCHPHWCTYCCAPHSHR